MKAIEKYFIRQAKKALVNAALDSIGKYKKALANETDTLKINLMNTGLLLDIKTIQNRVLTAAENKLNEIKGGKQHE